MKDQEIFTSISFGGKKLEAATQYLLTSNIGMMHQIKEKLHLSDSDIKDIYAETIAHLVWNIRTRKFLSESKISTYLYRMFYNKSVDHLRHTTTNKNRPTIDIDRFDIEIDGDLEANSYSNIDSAKVKEEINLLGSPCKGILLDWAYWGYSMKEIAQRNLLENGDIAKKKKYSCLQKLRAILKTKNIS